MVSTGSTNESGSTDGSTRLDDEEDGPQRDLLTDLGADLGDPSGERRLERQLHLHRLQHAERLAFGDLGAGGDIDREHGAGHRREQASVASGRAMVAEHVGPVEDEPLTSEDDLDGVGTDASDAMVGHAVERKSHLDVRAGYVGARQLGHSDPVDGVGTNRHHLVELHVDRGRVAAQTPAVVVERAAVGVGSRSCRPRREHAGHVTIRLRDFVVVEPGRVDGAVTELVARRQRAQEPRVGGQAEDRGVVQGGDERTTGRLAIGPVGDDLAEHRVVRRTHDLPALEGRVDAHSGVSDSRRMLDSGSRRSLSLARRPPLSAHRTKVAVPAWGRNPLNESSA